VTLTPLSRRRFVATLGAASCAQFAHSALGESNRNASPSPAGASLTSSSDYLLSPGLIHLNTELG